MNPKATSLFISYFKTYDDFVGRWFGKSIGKLYPPN